MSGDSTRRKNRLAELRDIESADLVQAWAAKGDFAIEHKGWDNWKYPGRSWFELELTRAVVKNALSGVLALDRR